MRWHNILNLNHQFKDTIMGGIRNHGSSLRVPRRNNAHLCWLQLTIMSQVNLESIQQPTIKLKFKREDLVIKFKDHSDQNVHINNLKVVMSLLPRVPRPQVRHCSFKVYIIERFLYYYLPISTIGYRNYA